MASNCYPDEWYGHFRCSLYILIGFGVQTLKASQKGTSAIVMHPQDGLTAVDPYGVVRVMDERPDRDPQNHFMNCFHVCTGQNMDPKYSSSPSAGCSIVDAYIINGLDRPLFMACSADGAVYIWEKCAACSCSGPSCLCPLILECMDF